MNSRILFFALFSILVMSFALPPKWEKLGSRKVNFGLERDTLPVGAHEGAFTKLKVHRDMVKAARQLLPNCKMNLLAQ